MSVVGKSKDGKDAMTLVKQHQPDICMMDIEMPVKSRLDGEEDLKQMSGFDCKVIILTTFARTGYFERARNAGVSGYLLKDSPSEDLANAIRVIMDARNVYAPELIDMVYEEQNPLTKREQEV